MKINSLILIDCSLIVLHLDAIVFNFLVFFVSSLPFSSEPQILTEEFFGDGKKKKVIKILKKDEVEKQKNRSEQLSQQSSSSSGRYVPQVVTSPIGTMDQEDEDELEANRKLLGEVRKQLFKQLEPSLNRVMKSITIKRVPKKKLFERKHRSSFLREV